MTSRKPASLGAGLIAKKGEAAPVAGVTSPTPPVAPQPIESARKEPSKAVSETIAVTVRLDPERYERLKVYGARKRKTNQDILVAALDAYLEQHGG